MKRILCGIFKAEYKGDHLCCHNQAQLFSKGYVLDDNYQFVKKDQVAPQKIIAEDVDWNLHSAPECQAVREKYVRS